MDGSRQGEAKAAMKMMEMTTGGREGCVGIKEIAGLLGLDEDALVRKVRGH